MADKDVGQDNELINDTLDDERDEKKQEKSEKESKVNDVVDKARQADDILKRTGNGSLKENLFGNGGATGTTGGTAGAEAGTAGAEAGAAGAEAGAAGAEAGAAGGAAGGATGGAAAGGAAAGAGSVLGVIAVVVLVLIICIGLIAFILNVPGFIRQKFNETVSGIVGDLKNKVYGTNNELSGAEIDIEERKKLLNYISSDLGLDVIGFGFVPLATYKDIDPNTGEPGEDAGKQIIDSYETKLGYVSQDERNKEMKSSNPDADLMYYYLMANERAYTINSNGNIFFKGALITYIGTNPIFMHFTPLAASLIFGHKNAWTGMLHIAETSKDENGFIKNAKQQLAIEEEIDRENKLLRVSVRNPSFENGLFNKDVYAFKLDGWTGRYGMPLEFSLALHIATMSSGLVKEMITNENLQAQVYIEMIQLTCDLDYTITMENGATLHLPYLIKNSANKTTAKDIIEKLDDDEKLEEGDLSFEALWEAAKTPMKGELPEDQIFDGLYPGITRHTQTIDALLDTLYMVVEVNNVIQYDITNPYDGEYSGCTVYKADNLVDCGREFGRYFINKYSIASGAFVCSLNGNFTNSQYDKSTHILYERQGKLGASMYTSDLGSAYEGKIDKDYAMFFKPSESDPFVYYVYTRGLNGTKEFNMAATQSIPHTTGQTVSDFSGTKTFAIVEGLGVYANESEEELKSSLLGLVRNDYSKYMSLLQEVDWFMGVIANSELGRNDGYQLDSSSYEHKLRMINAYLVDDGDINEGDYNAAVSYFNQIIQRLKIDQKYLEEVMKKNNTTYEKKVNRALADAGYNIDIATLRKINELYTGKDELIKDGEVEYAQPYITEVTRHWYRDVVFTGNEEFETVYEKSKEPFTLKYKGEELKNVQVEAVLTPQHPNDEDKDFYYVQKEQPYVIKGDTVFKDGLKDREIDPNNRMKSTNDEEYYYGDGYRTTKKLFTQGFYYTFDGTQETAKSVFWQQQIEDMAGQTVRITVINGKIYNVTSSLIIPDSNAENIASNGSEAPNNPAPPSGVSVQYAGSIAPKYNDETGKLERGGGANYILVVPSNMEYLSPADHSYTEVEQRAKFINDVWASMGITSFRQHVSFDNVVVETDSEGGETKTSGSVIANTGLSILKNCKTKDADYIYRDLKEMLIDLGYYTQAEFDQLDVQLKWLIPRYNPKQFPQNTTADLTFAAVLYPRGPEDESENKNKHRTTANPSGAGTASQASGSSQFIPMGGATIALSNQYQQQEAERNGEGSGGTSGGSGGTSGGSGGTSTSGDNGGNILNPDGAKQDKDAKDPSTIEELVTNSKDKGFRQDLQVIAPGACTVTEVEGNTIEIQFDGFAQPSISGFHNYKMTIVGIVPTVQVGAQLAEGDEIGRTGTETIKIFLKNDIGRIISNVSDYMSPRRGGNQPYDFTDDEIILLAYVINHEAAPDGIMIPQFEYEIKRGYIVSYETGAEAAMAFAEAVGYVLTNRTLINHGGFGTTIQEQTTAPGQYDGSFTIDYAVAHQDVISAGSMEAALTVAEFDCDIILKPDDPNITMSRDVTGESAWTWGHEVFWWVDMEGAYTNGNDIEGMNRNGEMDLYQPSGPKPYPTSANWPWDGYLTYSY